MLSVAAHEGREPFGLSFDRSPRVEPGAPGIDIEVPCAGRGHDPVGRQQLLRRPRQRPRRSPGAAEISSP